MTKGTSKNLIPKAKTSFWVISLIVGIFAVTALADNINLDMQGTTATIPKGNTIDRRIYRIPNGIPGRLRLKLKWHAVNVLPAYNRLRVRLMHGGRTIRTYNCYSIHSNRTPKCNYSITISQTEANRTGSWRLRITNNSGYEVTGFNIEKGSDINPLVPNFRTTYTPNCPSTVNLDMEGTTLTLTKGSTQFRKIYGIGKTAGRLRLKVKWHAVNVLPTYNRLRVQLLKPNGQIARSGNYYSYHARGKSPKLNYTYNISAADAALPGTWKLKVTNNSGYEVTGFNIEKGSDINPLVPNFFSSYKATCSF